MAGIIGKEKKKKEAIRRMKRLKILPKYIEDFKNDDVIYWFERYIGFFAIYQNDALMDYIKDFEQKHNALVYAVIYNEFEFGKCYTLLYVSDYEDEWETELSVYDNKYYCFAYVWNTDCPDYSEHGGVGIKSAMGGLERWC